MGVRDWIWPRLLGKGTLPTQPYLAGTRMENDVRNVVSPGLSMEGLGLVEACWFLTVACIGAGELG